MKLRPLHLGILLSDHGALLAGVAAGLVGLLMFVGLASPGFVIGKTSWFDSSRDPIQHVTGLRYFLASPWSFPLLLVPQLDFPRGTVIAFTDSLPLAALTAKLFLVPATSAPTVFAVWLTLCFFLQPVTFVWLLRSLKVSRPLILWIGGLFSLVSAPLLARLGHAALCGQFVIIGTMALHFTLTNGTRRPVPSIYWHVCAIILALLIHPYLMAMNAAIFGMTLLQLLWEDRLKWSQAATASVAAVACVLVAAFVLGLIGHGPVVPKPYGDYAFNLASPFVSRSSALLPFEMAEFGNESLLYLGCGGLLVIAASLVIHRHSLRSGILKYLPIVLVCYILTLFAATYSIRIGNVLVAGISQTTARELFLAGIHSREGLVQQLRQMTKMDRLRLALLPPIVLIPFGLLMRTAVRARRSEFLKFIAVVTVAAVVAFLLSPFKSVAILTNFQSSARFVWIAYYLALAVSIAALSHASRMRAAIVLSVALVIQVIDFQSLWGGVAALSWVQSTATFAQLEPVFLRSSSIDLVPNYECALQLTGRDDWEEVGTVYDNLHRLASMRATPINSIRHARMSTLFPARSRDVCAEEIKRSATVPLRPGSLRVFVDVGIAGVISGPVEPEDGECHPSEVGWWCRRSDES
jgi:hypothetical protein